MATVAFFTTNDTVSLATALRFYPNEIFAAKIAIRTLDDSYFTIVSDRS